MTKIFYLTCVNLFLRLKGKQLRGCKLFFGVKIEVFMSVVSFLCVLNSQLRLYCFIELRKIEWLKKSALEKRKLQCAIRWYS